MRGLLAGALFLLGFVPAQAETYFMSGQDLVRHCTAEDDHATGLCLGYISGVIDMEVLGNEILGECMSFRVPKTVTLIETRTAVLAYLQGHPEELKDPASYAVYQVMLKAYPCPG